MSRAKHEAKNRRIIEQVMEQHAKFPKNCEAWTSPVTWKVAKEYPWDDELHAKMDCVARRMQDKRLPPTLEKVLGEGTYGSVYVMAGVFTAKVPKVRYEEDGGVTDERLIREITLDNRYILEEVVRDSKAEFVKGLMLNSVPVPNFIKTYAFLTMKGKIEAGKPGSGGNIPVIIQERVDGEILYDWLQNNMLTLRDTIEVWMQIVYSLQMAVEALGGFAHNDLHGGNIMIQTLPEEIQIPYPLASGTRYLKTRNLVKILDFGLATVGAGAKALGGFKEDLIFRYNDYREGLYYVGGSAVQTYPFDLPRMEFWKVAGEDPDLRRVMGDIPRMHSTKDDKPRDIKGRTFREDGRTDVLRVHLYSQAEITAFMNTWKEDKYIQSMEAENERLGKFGAQVSRTPFESVTLGSCNPKLIKKAPKTPTKCAQPEAGWLNKETIKWNE